MLKNTVLALLFCSLLAFSPGICSAATIMDQELDRLEVIFNQLESNNKTQDEKLARASELLQKSEAQINLLNEKLTKAEQSINQAQNSLEKVNQSFTKYEKETQKEIRGLKVQRVVLGAVAMYFAVK